MSSSDKELEQQLMEAGNRLVDPPSSVEELLPLLDQVENCLSRVEQSPSQSMQNALSPSIKTLVTEQIFRHSDADVKVAVASCISEITRITAPDAPYDDDQMKEVFQLIVASFENLFDKSSRSYAKRASILETVAKVRSCVVMLDLECDALILEMFKHFLKAIRDYHPENVFSSMETIMTLVLEESEDISMELLSPLLACIKRDNEEVMPVARKLAERVLESCGNKLKPCLTQAVKKLGISLDDCSQVVASICRGTCNSINQDDGAVDNQAANENKLAKASLDDMMQEDQENIPGEAGPVKEVDVANDRSPKSVVSNGIVQEDDALLDSSLFKKQDHGAEGSSIATLTVHRYDNLSSENLVNIDKAEKNTKQRGRKSAPSKTEPFSSSSVDEKEAESLSEQKNENKHVPDSPHEDPSVIAAQSMENQKAIGDRTSSPKVIEGEIGEIASPTPSGADDNHLKKHLRTVKKEATIEARPFTDHASKRGLDRTSDSEAKSSRGLSKKAVAGFSSEDKIPCGMDERKEESRGASDLAKTLKQSIKIKKQGTRVSEAKLRRRLVEKAASGVSCKDKIPSAGDETNEESGGASGIEAEQLKQPNIIRKKGTGDSEAKSSWCPGKKPDVGVSSEDKIPSADETKEETGGVSDSEVQTLKQSVREVDCRKDNGGESLSKHSADKKKRSWRKYVWGKDEQNPSEKIDVEEMVTSPKSSKQSKDEAWLEETPKAIAKRKATASKEKVSDSVEYNESLVGSKVRVWWPKDRMFYEGVIDSFDPIKKKHKVLYNDGDEEVLNLRRQKWEVIADENESNEEGGTVHASPNASPEMPPKKKMKMAEQSTKQANVDASLKRGGSTTSSKLKSAATKSGRKLKDDTKSDSKSKTGSKSGSKLENDVTQTNNQTSKTVSKSADSVSKATGKSKTDDSDAPRRSKSKEDGVDSQKSTKSKQDASKSVKSKQETPKISSGTKRKGFQSGAKSIGSGANKPKSGSSKAIESESGKENLPEAQGSESKSGRKQQRR